MERCSPLQIYQDKSDTGMYMGFHPAQPKYIRLLYEPAVPPHVI